MSQTKLQSQLNDYSLSTGIARQAVINGNFTINQRVYVSAATLASGEYGHDRWNS